MGNVPISYHFGLRYGHTPISLPDLRSLLGRLGVQAIL